MPAVMEAKPKNITVQGNYTPIKGSDGRWTIKDVPIFGEIKKATKQIGKVTIEDLKQFLAMGQLRTKENCPPPIHLNHHSITPNDEIHKIGFFNLTRIESIIYEGEKTSVIMADLYGIKDEDFQLIKDAELPYRSVEIHEIREGEPEITSLALLEHQSPFFKLPLLTIKNENGSELGNGITFVDNMPMRAFQSINKNSYRILFSLEGDKNMADEVKKPDETTKPDEAKKEEPKKWEAMEAAEKIEHVFGLMTKHLAEHEAAKPKDETKEPEKQKPDGPVEMQNGKANEKSELFQLQGKVTVLEDEVSKNKKEKVNKSLVEKTKKDLAKFNINDIETKLFAVIEKGGEEGLKAFVEGIKLNATIDPPTTFMEMSGDDIKKDAVLMAFYAMGPEKFALAQSADREFKNFQASHPDADRKLFIEAYLSGGDGETPEKLASSKK